MEKKRKIRNIIAVVLLLAVAGGMAYLPTLLRSRKKEPDDKASYLSAAVERRTIRSTISGGGTLQQEKGTAVSVLKGVEITEYLVKNGDWVEKGQPLALVEPLSVRKTIATIQDNLDYISRQLKKNPEKIANDSILLPAPGRVKEIYAAVGDKVSDVMAEHGCLAVVSLDGLMALEIDAPRPVEQGRDLTVVLPDGRELTGRVEVAQGLHLTITLTDEGPRIGEIAEVLDENGESLGQSDLYVHSAWNVTAISGEISSVNAKAEKTLGMNGLLFNLKNVDFSQENRRLSDQRREYEEALTKLFALYDSSTLTAPAAGRVSGIDTKKVGAVRALDGQGQIVLLGGARAMPSAGDAQLMLLAGNGVPSPEKDKPSKYKNHSAAVSAINFGSVTFVVEKEPRKVKDYKDAPKIDYKKTKPDVRSDFTNIPIYALSGKKWKTITVNQLSVGDVLYFVKNKAGDLVMIVRSKQPEPEWGGGGGGGPAEEERFEMYQLTDVELMQVSPQNQMTVEVKIDELDILSVARGQTAEITVDALPGRAFSGTVTRIDPKGKNSGGNTRYTITITIDRDESMLQGMNATAILTVGQTENVLTVPAAALCQRGSRSFVYTGFDTEKRQLIDPVDVELGVSDGQTVEILSGLQEGDRVWYSYYETEALPILFSGQPTDEA